MGFAIASGHALTTEAAEQALRLGGTAVDACVAAACMAFVAEPVLAQPLGGGFLMVAPLRGPARLLDGFVETPRRRIPGDDVALSTVTVDFGTATQDFHIGAGTTATPCLIPALFEAHEQYGRVPMRELVAPAVDAARRGVGLTGFQAHVARLVAPILSATPEAAALHMREGRLAEAGSTMANSALADVLEVMAHEGPRFFSEGEIATALAEMPGGQIDRAALRAARPIWRRPQMLDRAGQSLALNPAPSLGGVQVALALAILPHRPAPVLVARALAEVAAARLASRIDDQPDEAAERLLAPALVDRLQKTLAAHRPATRGTTHISVIDGNGLGAALTLSNGEGNGMILSGTGIMPNNMLGEEDLLPDGPLSWRPGTRLASMMCPAAMRDTDGTLTMLGSGGSNRIRSAMTQVILGLADGGLGLEAAITAPRLHVDGDRLSFEDTGDEERRQALLADWPEATVWADADMYFGGVHVARRNRSGAVDAAGDPRRAGAAVTGRG
ncbi:gamma-glutamyltransferase [Halovulum dunhuangense]|uniref:Gamma-glutamyltransferase n=1 Tax=Halovulum dunhuangense TaxID=1505036 RepID=A0A849L592_9RHOB|nr:gamma-glutamyltransferase [Halovulum dunhuangense]NNU81545.1 gamma-glutamyltransferase [Halovulum dunhuangense]